MERIIHYTSNTKWEGIHESGFLLPKSHPNVKRRKLSDRVRSVIQNDSYLVGIPKPLDQGWIQYGLIDYLIEHTSGEVVLNVPIFDGKRGFVRDHALHSPKKSIEQHGEDLWKKCYVDCEIDKNDPG